MTSLPTTTAVVPAAGRGVRAGGRGRGKLFDPLCSRPLLAWTLGRLEACELVDHVAIVTRADLIEPLAALVKEEGFTKARTIVPGGAERAESVQLGVRAVPTGTTHIAIHDGARPLCPPEVLRRVIAAAHESGAALAAVPATDTIKTAEDSGCVAHTLARERLWLAQTPQAFELSLFARASKAWDPTLPPPTDDAMLVEALGHPVRLVKGAATNLKVTQPVDFVVAEALLRLEGADGP